MNPGRDDRETELKVMTSIQLKAAIKNIQPHAAVTKSKNVLVEMAYAISEILPHIPATLPIPVADVIVGELISAATDMATDSATVS